MALGIVNSLGNLVATNSNMLQIFHPVECNPNDTWCHGGTSASPVGSYAVGPNKMIN